MKIWFVEIGEPLPIETQVRPHRYGNFCKYLAQKGHHVTWWASNFSHMPKKHLTSKTEKIRINDYDLWLIHSRGYSKNVSLDRILHNKKFANDFFELAKNESPPDIIVSPIPTIENAAKALKLSQQWKIPIVADIRDEWPDEIINLLPSSLRFFGRILFLNAISKMKQFCSNVNGITGVSKRQLEFGLKYANREISNIDFVFPLGYPEIEVSEEELRKSSSKIHFDFKKFKLNVVFFGTLGRYFEFKSLREVAKNLPQVGFIIAGDGDKKNEIEREFKEFSNVYFPGWVNTPDIKYISSLSDIGFAPYVGSDSFSMPNKIYEYMSQGLVICSTLKGELEGLFKTQKIGKRFVPYDPVSLYEALNYWLVNPDELKTSKLNSRKYFEENFKLEKVLSNAERSLLNFITPQS